MSVQHNFLILISLIAVISSGCTAIAKFPIQRDTVKPPVSEAEDSSSTEQSSPTGQLAALHATTKVDIAWIFQYYRLISTVPAKVLNDEFERTNKEYSADKTPWNQWQLAMLLSLPSASFYDSARSSALFKDLADTGAGQGPVINDAAFLMYSWTKQQHQTYQKAADLEQKLTEAQSANKTLQDQLEALKAIEENLYQRNKVEVSPKP